jgi:hypothetical protein
LNWKRKRAEGSERAGVRAKKGAAKLERGRREADADRRRPFHRKKSVCKER